MNQNQLKPIYIISNNHMDRLDSLFMEIQSIYMDIYSNHQIPTNEEEHDRLIDNI